MSEQSTALIARTGQNRMLLFSVYGFIGAVVLMLATPALLRQLLGYYGIYVFSVSAIVAVACISVAILFVRCPRCGLQWVAWAMSHQRRGLMMHWLRTFTTCPKCGLNSKEVT